jgi:hypothetical protein
MSAKVKIYSTIVQFEEELAGDYKFLTSEKKIKMGSFGAFVDATLSKYF